MLEEENRKQHWLKIAAIVLITFIVSFLAFYLAMEWMMHRISDPVYNAKRLEKIMLKQEHRFQTLGDKMMENPFEPKMRPMLVNLVKENDAYEVIVDLKPLEGDEKNINVQVEDKMLTISGELDKKWHDNERIINFTQSYYLDEKLQLDKMTKEKKGDKFIITIPYED